MLGLIQEIGYQEVQRLLKENMAQQRKDRSLMAESSDHTRGWRTKRELPEPEKSEASQRRLEEHEPGVELPDRTGFLRVKVFVP